MKPFDAGIEDLSWKDRRRVRRAVFWEEPVPDDLRVPAFAHCKYRLEHPAQFVVAETLLTIAALGLALLLFAWVLDQPFNWQFYVPWLVVWPAIMAWKERSTLRMRLRRCMNQGPSNQADD